MSARLKRVRITTRTTATDLVGEATQTYGSAASSSRQGFCHSYQPAGARIGNMFAQLGVALKHQLDLAALLEPLLCKFCRKGEDFRADLFANITGCIRMLCLAPDALWHNDIDLPTTSTRPTSDPTTTSIWIAATAGQRPMIHKLATELATKKKVKPGLNIHGLRHSLGKELYDLGLEREARKAVMAHESDAASKVYERDGDRSKQADRAVRALNRQHLKIGDEGT